MVTFNLECYQNEYLDDRATDIDAIVRITATGTGTGAAAAPTTDPTANGRTEIIMIDASGSMDGPRLREARDAAAAAIDCIEDGTRFAVIAGNHLAWRLYPDVPGTALAVASPSSREDARRAVRRVQASGGTAMGQWIELAAGLVRGERGINHAILLTDGIDESEQPADLDRAIASATGIFQCDCRGVGADWEPSELRRIATGLLGTADIVADPRDLTDDFQAMMKGAMAKQLGDVAVRIWTPPGAKVQFVKLVSPQIQDLAPGPPAPDGRTVDYPTGAWGDESRDYHVSVRVPPADIGDEMLAGRVTLVVGGEPAGQALVRAVWTNDIALSTRINKELAHYTNQEEAADLIVEAIDARRGGDDDLATDKLTRALKLSRQSGNTGTAERILKIVDEEPNTGRLTLKRDIDPVDEKTIETRSTRTNRADP
jgi:von Willebrand factor type A domain/von Willebrand factor type A C-terminal domain